MGYSWFRVDSAFADHPKTMALALELRNSQAGMYFIRLLSWAQRYAPEDGVICPISDHPGIVGSPPRNPDEISERSARDRRKPISRSSRDHLDPLSRHPSPLELALGWHGGRGRLIDAFIKVGFIDVKEGHLEVHDWGEHQGYWIKKSINDKELSKARRAAKKLESRDSRTTDANKSRDSRTTDANKSRDSRTTDAGTSPDSRAPLDRPTPESRHLRTDGRTDVYIDAPDLQIPPPPPDLPEGLIGKIEEEEGWKLICALRKTHGFQVESKPPDTRRFTFKGFVAALNARRPPPTCDQLGAVYVDYLLDPEITSPKHPTRVFIQPRVWQRRFDDLPPEPPPLQVEFLKRLKPLDGYTRGQLAKVFEPVAITGELLHVRTAAGFTHQWTLDYADRLAELRIVIDQPGDPNAAHPSAGRNGHSRPSAPNHGGAQ